MLTHLGPVRTQTSPLIVFDDACVPLVREPILPTCDATVIVPVKDEEGTLAVALGALARQVDRQGRALPRERYEIIVLANNCRDASADVARAAAARHPGFRVHVVEAELRGRAACVGFARRLLMEEACRRQLSRRRGPAVIASTDGDTVVTPDWLSANFAELAAGADAVGGRVQTDDAERAEWDPWTRACYLRRVAYGLLRLELESFLDPDPHDPFPRHYYHNGASFALTARAYRDAGGMPAVPTSEDVALYHALLRSGARVRHSPNVVVKTSARLAGRAVQGMADQLSAWRDLGGKQPMVEPVAASSVRLAAHRRLRVLYAACACGEALSEKALVPLAENLAVPLGWLTERVAASTPLGWLYHEIEALQAGAGRWRDRWPAVPIDRAVGELRVRVGFLRRAQAGWREVAECRRGARAARLSTREASQHH